MYFSIFMYGLAEEALPRVFLSFLFFADVLFEGEETSVVDFLERSVAETSVGLLGCTLDVANS